MNKKIETALILIFVYLLSLGASYFLFSSTPFKNLTSPLPPPATKTNGDVVFDETLPKTEACPLTGVLYSKQQKKWWEEHRPLGVMIENHEDSRPQSGISRADAVYEAVAEGGITRMLNVYYCQAPAQVGPVRSARTYFLDFISEYGDSPLYAHVAGANTPGPADALGQIEDYDWGSYNDLNQFSIGFPTFWRDYNRLGHPTATEHTMYSSTTKLWNFAAKDRKLTNKDEDGKNWDEDFESYSFKDDAKTSDRGDVGSVHIEFWENNSDYFVDWKFDLATNSYLRSHGKTTHTDLNTKKQISAKNVVALFMRESSANDGYEDNVHLLYATKGSGKAQVYMDGEEISGTWRKSDREARTIILDSTGNEVEFNGGLTW